MFEVKQLFGILSLFNNIILTCILFLRNVIDIMSAHFSLVQKIRTIDSHIICNTVGGKLVAYVDGICNTINTCFKILACTLIKIGMMNPVFVIFKLYTMVLKLFFDVLKQSTIYGDISTFVGYLGNIWKMTTLLPIVSAFISGDITHVVSFFHSRTLLGLVLDCISQVVSLSWDLMIMIFKHLFNVSCRIAIYGLKVSYDMTVKGWENLIWRSSIYQELDRQVTEAKKKLEEMEKNQGNKLEQARRRAENEMKRRREASDNSTSQIRQVHERLAIVAEELRSKRVQIEDLESRMYEDKLSECWRGLELKREEELAAQNIRSYY